MIEAAIANFNLINAITAGICAIIQLILKRKTAINYLIAFLYFLMAYVLFYFWSFRSGSIYNFPYLIYSDLAATFAIGPTAYLYIRRLSKTNIRFTVSSFYHYIPTIIAICALLAYHAINDSIIKNYLINRPEYPHYAENLFIYILSIIADISLFSYFLLSGKNIYALITSERFKSLKELRILFFIFTAVAVNSSFLFYAHYLENDLLIAIVSGINGLLGILYFLFIYRHPGITQTVIKNPKEGRKTIALPATVDLPRIMEDLMTRMETENLYRNPKISIQSLSNSLGINRDNLSLVLNEKLGVNFRTFINRYRLEEAKTLLAENSEKSILEIAFFVGFNSKSAFNTIFAKTTGLTPTEYRRKYLKDGLIPASDF